MKQTLKITLASFAALATCFAALVLPAELAYAEEGDPDPGPGPLCGGLVWPGPPNAPNPCEKDDPSCAPSPPPKPAWTWSCCHPSHPGNDNNCHNIEWRAQCCVPCNGDPKFWGNDWREDELGDETTCGGTDCLTPEPPGGPG